MSLINQMLQDLEQRNASATSTQPLSGEVRSVASVGSSYSAKFVALGLMVLALLVIGVWLLTHRTPKPILQITPPATQGAVDSGKPVVQAAVSPIEPLPAPAPESVVPALPADEAKHNPARESKSSASVSKSPGSSGPKISGQVPVATPQDSASANTVTASVVTENAAKAPVIEKQKSTTRTAAAPAGTALKTVSPAQQSDNFYRQGVLQMQQGRVAEARETLTKSLEANPTNLKARQVLVGMMVETKHNDEATSLLQEGLKLSPEQTGFSKALARLQVESGDSPAAMATLDQGIQYAGEDAEYHAFYAALLQRDGRHDEAIQHYLVALKSDPAMPTWLVGIGISLQTQGKSADATEAFQRAKDTGQLTPQLSQFVDQRLGQLKH